MCNIVDNTGDIIFGIIVGNIGDIIGDIICDNIVGNNIDITGDIIVGIIGDNIFGNIGDNIVDNIGDIIGAGRSRTCEWCSGQAWNCHHCSTTESEIF